MRKQITKIIDVIKKNKTFLISTHVGPDPDALCSELAIAQYLRSLGKKVIILNEKPILERFKFFPGSKKIQALKKNKQYKYDVAIIVDCGDLSRIGDVQEKLIMGAPVINIDHHITNDNFGSINLVDPKASSTAEVLYEVLKVAKYKMDSKIALNLYSGMMTDTGSFRYENTSPRTFEVASDLMKHNLKVDELYRRLYETIPFNDLQAFSKVISKFDRHCENKVVSVSLRKSMLKGFSEEFDLRDAIFKFLRSIKGVEVIFILTENSAKQTRINFRSSSYVDVARLANSFGGGGHIRASGGMIDLNIKESKLEILKEIKKVI